MPIGSCLLHQLLPNRLPIGLRPSLKILRKANGHTANGRNGEFIMVFVDREYRVNIAKIIGPSMRIRRVGANPQSMYPAVNGPSSRGVSVTTFWQTLTGLV